MEILSLILNFILHIDIYMGEIIVRFGIFSYAILFSVIFAETGFVLTPFLPGDSLLFAAGAFSARGSFNLLAVFLILLMAAFLGDTANYWIGYYFGRKLINDPRIPINQEHINKARDFYKKHGGKTIFLARFIPIIRTLAPFVAGIGRMDYRKFISFNFTGGFVWVFGLIILGYFFGNLPKVKENFSLVVIAVVLISVTPILIELLKEKLRKEKA